MNKNKIIACIVLSLLITAVMTGCSKADKSEKTIEYSLGNMSFNVFESWVLDETNSDEKALTFVEKGEDPKSAVKDSMTVQYKTIPEIMKIDTGDGGIKTKEDVVKKYSYGSSDFVDLTFSEWKVTNEVEYCEQYFEYEGKLADGSYGNRYGREIIVPINKTEAYFIAMSVGDAEADLKNLDVIIDSLHQNN